MRRILFAALALALADSAALGASAVVYGQSAVATASARDVAEAMRQAFEQCSMSDRACRLLITCDEPGYGHVTAAYVGKLIESVGAVCGQKSHAVARDHALELCRESAQQGACENKASWIDR